MCPFRVRVARHLLGAESEKIHGFNRHSYPLSVRCQVYHGDVILYMTSTVIWKYQVSLYLVDMVRKNLLPFPS